MFTLYTGLALLDMRCSALSNLLRISRLASCDGQISSCAVEMAVYGGTFEATLRVIAYGLTRVFLFSSYRASD